MKVSIKGLRFLLKHVDMLDDELTSIKELVSENIEELQRTNLEVVSWSNCYELEFEKFLAFFIVSLDLHHDLKEYKDLEFDDGLTKFSDQVIGKLDLELESSNEEEAKELTLSAMTFGYVMVSCVKSLMVYGYYMNDLVKIARDNKNTRKGDDALLKAIRIDPCVIGCITASSRLSYAVLFDDKKFLRKLQNAMTGKLGARESKNYQKMRLVLQVLHEAKADQMSDSELNDLFVEQLKLYSDTQGTSEKNIKEFRYSFQKQKNTIQKDKK